MRCIGCQYLGYAKAESNLTTCYVFCDDILDEYARQDGESCICNDRQLNKLYKQAESAWLEDAQGFVDFMKSNGSIESQDIADIY